MKEQKLTIAKSTHRPSFFAHVDWQTANIMGLAQRIEDVMKAYDEVLTDSEIAIIDLFLEKIRENCKETIIKLDELDNPDIEIFLNKKLLDKEKERS